MLRTKPVITLCKQPKLLDKNRRLELSAKNLQYSTETEFSLKFSFARLPASQAKWIFYSITVTRRREHTRWVFMVCVCMCVCVHILILIRIYCATQQKATMRKTCRPPRADWSLSASPGRQLSSCPTVVCRLSVCLLVLSMPAWLQYVFHCLSQSHIKPSLPIGFFRAFHSNAAIA